MQAPTDPSSAHGWRSHYTVVILMLVYMMSFIDRQIMGILVEPIKREFGISDAAMGVLGGVTFALFYTALSIPFSRYADRSNRRNFVAWCCAAWSAMTALCGAAVGFWSLALARVGVAVGEAGGTAPSLSMVADHYPPHRRGRAMGVYWLGPQFGILFGLTLGGWIAQNYGWRAAFIWMGLPGIFLALLLRYTGVEPARGRWEGGAASAAEVPVRVLIRELMASSAFKRITLAGLMMGLAGYAIGMWTPAFLVRSHGMTLQGAGVVMGLLGGLMAAFGALISGWLCDTLARRDPRWRVGVPLLGCVLTVPSALAFYAWPAGDAWTLGTFVVPKAVAFYMCFGITAAWWTAPVYTVLSELAPAERRATTISIFNLGIVMLGAGVGPLLVGVVSDLLTPRYGSEALRWALLASAVGFYALGIFAFLATLNPYGREVAAKHKTAAG